MIFVLLYDYFFFFFFIDTPTTEIYTSRHTLSLHDALPISVRQQRLYRRYQGNGGGGKPADSRISLPALGQAGFHLPLPVGEGLDRLLGQSGGATLRVERLPRTAARDASGHDRRRPAVLAKECDEESYGVAMAPRVRRDACLAHDGTPAADGVKAVGNLGAPAEMFRFAGRGLFMTRLVPITMKTPRSEEHTSELQSLMRISYAVFCLKTKNNKQQ